MTAPLVNSELTVEELLQSENVIANEDSSLKIVYSSELFSITTDSFAQLPDTTFELSASLENLELPNDTIEVRITMGEIMRNSDNFIIQALYNLHGSPSPFSASTSIEVSGESFDFSMVELFDELTLDTGVAEVVLSNEMQYDLTNIQFQLGNAPQPGGDLLISDTYSSLAKGSTISETYSLDSGTVILSDLVGQIINLNVSVNLIAGVTIIDTSEYISAKIIVKEIKPSEAIAVWPDQNIIEVTDEVPFASNVTIDFKEATIRGGELYFEIESTINDSIFLTYTIPNLVKDDVDTFSVDVVVPPSTDSSEGNRTTLIKSYPMTGYHFTFNGLGYSTPTLDDDEINKYVTKLTAKIKYTGEKKRISLSDRLYVKAQVRDLLPTHASGFLNNKIVSSGPSVVSFEAFNQIKSGQFDIEDVNFEIEVDNGIGGSAEAEFLEVKGTNFKGEEVLLDFMGNETMEINSAKYQGDIENYRTEHITTTKSLDPNNSNIDDFIENLPKEISYNVNVELNANVPNPGERAIVENDTPPNFIHYLDEVKARLNMEIPLSIVTDSLVLVDTLDFNLNTNNDNEVESGKFKLLVNNGFPFDANTSLYFMDETGLIIDSLWIDQTITRGTVNNSGVVSSPVQSVIEFEISKEQMENIQLASKLYIEAGFHTFDITNPEKEYYKIYSHYSFGVKLVGDFKYQFSN